MKNIILIFVFLVNSSLLLAQNIELPDILLSDKKSDDNSEHVLSGTDIDLKTNSSGTQENEVKDTTVTKSEIHSVWEANNRFFVKVSLTENNTPIELKMFNMLGKLVVDIYKGEADDGDVFDYEADLQNGIYICVLTGPKIRDAEKFILSR